MFKNQDTLGPPLKTLTMCVTVDMGSCFENLLLVVREDVIHVLKVQTVLYVMQESAPIEEVYAVRAFDQQNSSQIISLSSTAACKLRIFPLDEASSETKSLFVTPHPSEKPGHVCSMETMTNDRSQKCYVVLAWSSGLVDVYDVLRDKHVLKLQDKQLTDQISTLSVVTFQRVIKHKHVSAIDEAGEAGFLSSWSYGDISQSQANNLANYAASDTSEETVPRKAVIVVGTESGKLFGWHVELWDGDFTLRSIEKANVRAQAAHSSHIIQLARIDAVVRGARTLLTSVGTGGIIKIWSVPALNLIGYVNSVAEGYPVSPSCIELMRDQENNVGTGGRKASGKLYVSVGYDDGRLAVWRVEVKLVSFQRMEVSAKHERRVSKICGISKEVPTELPEFLSCSLDMTVIHWQISESGGVHEKRYFDIGAAIVDMVLVKEQAIIALAHEVCKFMFAPSSKSDTKYLLNPGEVNSHADKHTSEELAYECLPPAEDDNPDTPTTRSVEDPTDATMPSHKTVDEYLTLHVPSAVLHLEADSSSVVAGESAPATGDQSEAFFNLRDETADQLSRHRRGSKSTNKLHRALIDDGVLREYLQDYIARHGNGGTMTAREHKRESTCSAFAGEKASTAKAGGDVQFAGEKYVHWEKEPADQEELGQNQSPSSSARSLIVLTPPSPNKDDMSAIDGDPPPDGIGFFEPTSKDTPSSTTNADGVVADSASHQDSLRALTDDLTHSHVLPSERNKPDAESPVEITQERSFEETEADDEEESEGESEGEEGDENEENNDNDDDGDSDGDDGGTKEQNPVNKERARDQYSAFAHVSAVLEERLLLVQPGTQLHVIWTDNDKAKLGEAKATKRRLTCKDCHKRLHTVDLPRVGYVPHFSRQATFEIIVQVYSKLTATAHTSLYKNSSARKERSSECSVFSALFKMFLTTYGVHSTAEMKLKLFFVSMCHFLPEYDAVAVFGELLGLHMPEVAEECDQAPATLVALCVCCYSWLYSRGMVVNGDNFSGLGEWKHQNAQFRAVERILFVHPQRDMAIEENLVEKLRLLLSCFVFYDHERVGVMAVSDFESLLFKLRYLWTEESAAMDDDAFDNAISATKKRFLDLNHDGQLCYLDFWVMLYIVGVKTRALISLHKIPSFCRDYRLEVSPELSDIVWNYMLLSCTLVLPKGLRIGKSSMDQKAERQHRRRVGEVEVVEEEEVSSIPDPAPIEEPIPTEEPVPALNTESEDASEEELPQSIGDTHYTPQVVKQDDTQTLHGFRFSQQPVFIRSVAATNPYQHRAASEQAADSEGFDEHDESNNHSPGDLQDKDDEDAAVLADTPLIPFRRKRLDEDAERALYGERIVNVLGEGIAFSPETEAAMKKKWQEFFDDSESKMFTTMRNDLEKKQTEQREAEERQIKLRKKWQEQRDQDLIGFSTRDRADSTDGAGDAGFRLRRIHRESCRQLTEELQFGVSVQRELKEARESQFFHFYYLPEGHGSIITLKMHVLRGDAEVFMSTDTKVPCSTDFMWRSSERLAKDSGEGHRIILYPHDLLKATSNAASKEKAATMGETASLRSFYPKQADATSLRVEFYLSVVALEPGTAFTLAVMSSGQKMQPSRAIQTVDYLIDRFNMLSRSFQEHSTVSYASIMPEEVVRNGVDNEDDALDEDDDEDNTDDESTQTSGGRRKTRRITANGTDPQELKSFQRLLETLSEKERLRITSSCVLLLAGPSEEHLEFVQDEDQRLQEMHRRLSPPKSCLEGIHGHHDAVSVVTERRLTLQGKRQKLRRVVAARLQQKLAPLRHKSSAGGELEKSASTGSLMDIRRPRPVAD
ncbi:EF-Hand 1, calcium-binding site [Phytophthora cactorum]|nr:EF-Hand 1, calcium-binding site [Phytophthora cactorum]